MRSGFAASTPSPERPSSRPGTMDPGARETELVRGHYVGAQALADVQDALLGDAQGSELIDGGV